MPAPRYNKDTGEWELPDRTPTRDADRTDSQALPPSVGVIEPQDGSQSRLWGIAAGVLAFLAGAGAGVFIDQWDLSAILDSITWWTS